MRLAVARLERRISDLNTFDAEAVNDSRDPKLSALERSVDDTLVEIFGSDTVEYARDRNARTLDYAHYSIMLSNYKTQVHEIRETIKRNIARSLEILQGLIRTLKEKLEHSAEREPEPKLLQPRETSLTSDQVFIVHGHDHQARETVARFVEQLGFRAVILHEQPNEGRTIIEKFEKHGETAGFAVLLLTPDDIGGPKGIPADQLRLRARQNVVAELFFFIGKLGRKRVCALRKGDVETPSDLDGVVYTAMDAGDGWKLGLAREMRAAGLPVDFNKAFGG